MLSSAQYAYVLHQRPYTDSRLLIEFLTEDSGLIRAVARVPGKRQKGIFQCFQRVHLEFWGTSDLKTLRGCESAGVTTLSLSGDTLYCGFYINELLQRLLPLEEPCPEIFRAYEAVVAELALCRSRPEQESGLRCFEFFLLEYLGFAVVLDTCAVTGAEVQPELAYVFEAGSGLHENAQLSRHSGAWVIPGAQLLAMARRDFTDPAVRKSAKKITRVALRQLLGPRPLGSKDLFL